MSNPFVGEISHLTDTTPYHLLEGLTADEVETLLYVKKETKKKKRKFKSVVKKFLKIRGATPPCVFIHKGIHIETHKNEWKNYNKSLGTKQIEGITTQVIKVSKKDKQFFTDKLKTDIDDYEDFLFSELSTAFTSFDSAVETVEQKLGVILESEVSTSSMDTMRSILRDSIILKALNFIAEKHNLDNIAKNVLVDKYFRRRNNENVP